MISLWMFSTLVSMQELKWADSCCLEWLPSPGECHGMNVAQLPIADVMLLCLTLQTNWEKLRTGWLASGPSTVWTKDPKGGFIPWLLAHLVRIKLDKPHITLDSLLQHDKGGIFPKWLTQSLHLGPTEPHWDLRHEEIWSWSYRRN